MKSDDALPGAPEVARLDPQMMTAPELQQKLEELFGWLQAAEATQKPELVDEKEMQAVRDAANMLLHERRERHSDESAPRGG